MALEQDIANLVESTNQLTSVIDNKAKTIDAKMAQLDSRVAAKEAQVDQFIQDATPETRYEQTITIGGSKDYLYPVWWRFPGNEEGVSKLTVSRHYSWNSNTKPLNPTSGHQAGLLLQLEGNAYSWNGDSNFMNIKRFYERYNNTVSHVDFRLNCKAEKIDLSKDFYGGGEDGTLGPWHCTYSGLYLRGGGLTYRITKNWKGDVAFHDGSDMERRNTYESSQGNWTVRWFVEPIPFTDRVAPIANTIPYVNHPYTPPAPASA
ncbi:phage tail protein [Pseudoalteromonas sp. MSK9-3]|uniref:phage tail protein n=1 Tax=Pseudoalteromonas sp. MSK9-3 TaxID=1897633 RepID=UPI000E6B8A18|nr:phage tail protein [Pseudoalteromonas sp. MSK9-3]RJE78166.1 phage tail protein [Pseudoalteromonas sp. MSK9-3]